MTLPATLSVMPRIPLGSASQEQLEEERDYWTEQRDSALASEPSDQVKARICHDFLRDVERELAGRP